MQVTVFNEATYAEAVHGEKQAKYHAKRGWKRLDKTADAESPKITKLLQAQLDKVLNK